MLYKICYSLILIKKNICISLVNIMNIFLIVNLIYLNYLNKIINL